MLFSLTPARIYSGGPTQRGQKFVQSIPGAYLRELPSDGKDPGVSSTRQFVLRNGENRLGGKNHLTLALSLGFCINDSIHGDNT